MSSAPNTATKTCAGLTTTLTAAGYVPHMSVRLPDGRLLAPVKLATQANSRGGSSIVYRQHSNLLAPEPLSRDGKYVYALPGGGEIAA